MIKLEVQSLGDRVVHQLLDHLLSGHIALAAVYAKWNWPHGWE
jgi:hypothetical protein